MYAAALAVSGATTVALGIPHFQLGSLDVGIPIQAFGVIVAIGVLIGAALLRRYAEWHGVADEHIRGILGWITITGFLGAHWFDVFAYEPHKLSEQIASWPPSKWPVLLRIWDGISSYGGFVGGAIGFAVYVWWKRLPIRLMADIAIVGLLPAFSIGRIGCTVVSDHIGSVVDKTKWYVSLAMAYPRPEGVNGGPFPCGSKLARDFTPVERAHCDQVMAGVKDLDSPIPMWNLGLVELAYLVPVNIIVLWLAFRSSKRMPAGFITVLTGLLYAPVRFFMDYLRPTSTDPRHLGLTFAQWASLLAFAVAVYAASRILKGGKAADVVAPTSKEAQAKLKIILKEDDDKEKEKKQADKLAKKPEASKRAASEDDDDDDDDADEEKPTTKHVPRPKKVEETKVEPKSKVEPAKKQVDDKKPEAKQPKEPKAEEPKPEVKQVEEPKAEAKKPEVSKAEDEKTTADEKK